LIVACQGDQQPAGAFLATITIASACSSSARLGEARFAKQNLRMTLETIAPLSDDPVVGLPAVAALTDPAQRSDQAEGTRSRLS